MTAPIQSLQTELEGLSLPGVNTVVFTEECESTQDAAKILARAGCSEGTLVLSLAQTRGRGRLERQWYSPPGGLYMSLVLRPLAKPEDYSALTLRVASCITRSVGALYGVKTHVKPPNDVYACDGKGDWRKLAGILTETGSSEEGPWVVLGMGVNLSNQLPRELEQAAVSVSEITGQETDIPAFLRRLFSLFQPEYSAWQTGAASRLK